MDPRHAASKHTAIFQLLTVANMEAKNSNCMYHYGAAACMQPFPLIYPHIPFN